MLNSTSHFSIKLFVSFFSVQIEKAFDHMVENCSKADCKVRLNVVCGSSKHKGIYIRDSPQDKPRDVPVTIEPIFADHFNIGMEINSFSFAII